jgi:hypothetical protein
LLTALASAAPADATATNCSTIGVTTIINPATQMTQAGVVEEGCVGGPSVTTPISLPSGISGIFSSAPPDSQYYEFSAPTGALDIQFLSASTDDSGSLNLYNSSDLSIDSASIAYGNGLMDVTGLGVGNNYILGVVYDVPTDPPTSLFFSSAINSPVTGVPEPISLSLFGAGLLGLGFLYRRQTVKRAAQ